VCYGTDGGVLGELSQLVVLGPGSVAQAHTADEWIALEQLRRGADLYQQIIERWCCE
jgi:acetylornithine deacetylase